MMLSQLSQRTRQVLSLQGIHDGDIHDVIRVYCDGEIYYTVWYWDNAILKRRKVCGGIIDKQGRIEHESDNAIE